MPQRIAHSQLPADPLQEIRRVDQHLDKPLSRTRSHPPIEGGSSLGKQLSSDACQFQEVFLIITGQLVTCSKKNKNQGTYRGFLGMDPTAATLRTDPTPMNGTGEDLSSSDIGIVILSIFILVIALIGLAGNSVVLWLLAFHMHKKTSFHIYLSNLATADFFSLCFSIIFSLEIFYTFSIFRYFEFLLNFTYITELSILSAISTERYLSVQFPIWYHCRRPRTISAVICALLWTLSLVLNILEGNFCGLFSKDFENFWYYPCRVVDFVFVSWLIFSFLLLSGSSLALLVRLFSGSQRMKLTRLYMTIGLTVLVFLLCGLPFGVQCFLLVWIQDDFLALPYYTFWVVTFLSSVNSSANPFVYFFVGSFRQRQQQSLKLVLLRALEDNHVGESEGSAPQETLQMEVSRVC
ncbi:mas-related G-protein coupled receptor member X1-like [Sorex fumeus]|uniref:mas-related G-protein coupled receptor member X1-like n=1 Tax=Sorex fumeus TaxID=62283 RepID=UPI0024AD0327|nr:mas-related G-protein coupled receptor member X1-like [Sorex fumeus]